MPPELIEHDGVGDEPVFSVENAEDQRGPQPGIGLCLSGGGFRAMLFHVGTLLRLNEAGLLPRLNRISSVSGGSITSGVLGLRWKYLDFDGKGIARRLIDRVVEPIRALARRTIDEGAIIGGILLPGSVADRVVKAYDKYLFDGKTLRDIPENPRFVINATNVQSGVLWRFSNPYMADYRVGKILGKKRTVPLAQAVAASSAFPPVLSPMEFSFEETDYEPESGMDLQYEPYTTEVVLSDGGVYDNLGLETCYKRYQTILVSDGGGNLEPEPDPKRNWVHHSYRILSLIDNQVRSLRKRQLIDSYEKKMRSGAYWGIRTKIANYGAPDSLPCPLESTIDLANTPTRLKKIDDERQERLINWGYAVCDAAIRRHYDPTIAKPKGFPYPQVEV